MRPAPERTWSAVPGERLDAFLARHLGWPRLRAHAEVLAGRVEVDGRPGKPQRLLQAGQVVRWAPAPLRPAEAEPEDLPLPVVYEDADLVVVDKPAGMATHPGPGWWHGSAVNALLHRCAGWTGVGGVATPGIVHRLDRDTSGLLVFAKGEPAHGQLLDALRAGAFDRRYLAVVVGALTAGGRLDWPLARDQADPERVVVRADGKRAVTHVHVLGPAEPGPAGPRTWVALALETGRTHQIRVHLAHLGHPVVGDPRYGSSTAGQPMALHAAALGFPHPRTGKRLDFRSLPPATWAPHGHPAGGRR